MKPEITGSRRKNGREGHQALELRLIDNAETQRKLSQELEIPFVEPSGITEFHDRLVSGEFVLQFSQIPDVFIRRQKHVGKLEKKGLHVFSQRLDTLFEKPACFLNVIGDAMGDAFVSLYDE
jgi:hypothetical protein